MPRPRSAPPHSTTIRVPYRSDSAPHMNAPTPMQRKFSIAAVAIPVRDQPMADAMGWRKTLSVSIAPNPTQVTPIPTPTMTQP